METAMPDSPEYFDLCRAAKLFPGDPSMACIWRWCRKGCKARSGRRVTLKHVRSGGKLYITREWANEFLAELASEDQKHFTPEPVADAMAVEVPALGKPRTDQQRAAAIAQAERVVASWGTKNTTAIGSKSNLKASKRTTPSPTPLRRSA
jgi:hypothetical protein